MVAENSFAHILSTCMFAGMMATFVVYVNYVIAGLDCLAHVK